MRLSNRVLTRLSRWGSLLLLAVLLVGALPLAAQDATPRPSPTPLPTDGPPPEGPVSTVNGVELSAASFQDRVRLTRFLYSYTIRETLAALVARGTPAQDAFRAVQQFYSNEIGRLLIADMLADNALDTMEEDALLTQLAEREGVEVTDADVEAKLEAYVGQAETIVGGATQAEADPEATAEATAEATDEPTPDRLGAMIAEAEERVNVSEATIREFFRGQALRDAWMEHQLGPFPTEWPVITARHILVETEEAANDVLARLEAGEDFATLAGEVSIDTVTGANGGELPPAVPETYVGPFADAIRDAEVGVIIGPVQSDFGYHIIEVTDRTVQPIDDSARRALLRTRTTEFQNWIEEQLASAEIVRQTNWPSMIPNQPTGQELLQAMLEDL